MSLPDGPKSPKIWQMFQWITMPFSFMRGCSDRYGDRFTLSFFSRKLPPVVFFSNPQALQVILTSDDSELFDSPGDLNVLLEPLIGTESVMGLSGDRHRRTRQLLMPSFHGERMRSYGQLIRGTPALQNLEQLALAPVLQGFGTALIVVIVAQVRERDGQTLTEMQGHSHGLGEAETRPLRQS
jgi:cytochrome P450